MVITLNKKSKSVKYIYSKSKQMAKVIDLVGTITYKPYSNSYVFLIDTIIGQMLSNKVADVMSNRLLKLCNNKITIGAIDNLSDADIKSIGISSNKVKSIKELTKKIKSKEIVFAKINKLNDDEIIRVLTTIHGIGTWSAKMYLMFVLNRQDILPYEDMAFIQAYAWCYKTKKIDRTSIENRFKNLKPYRSIASRYLYTALNYNLINSRL